MINIKNNYTKQELVDIISNKIKLAHDNGLKTLNLSNISLYILGLEGITNILEQIKDIGFLNLNLSGNNLILLGEEKLLLLLENIKKFNFKKVNLLNNNIESKGDELIEKINNFGFNNGLKITGISLKMKKILTNDFYKQLKKELKWYSNNEIYGKLFSRLGKKGEIIKGIKDNNSKFQFYFVNIDKLLKLSIHDVKFLIDLILIVAQLNLKNKDIGSVNFCSLEFEKILPSNRGLGMLKYQQERGKVKKFSKNAIKMRIKIKKKDLIKIK